MATNLDDLKIPPLPLVTVQVMRFDPLGANASSFGLEQLIMPDKGVSAEILRVSNASYYGRSGKVKSLRDAITLLGLKTVKNLVILLATKSMTANVKNATLRRFQQELPIITALVASQLSEELDRKQLKDDAFTGGLLHKIGMTILAMNQPKDYAHLLDESESRKIEFTELERKYLKTDHLEVSRKAFEFWNLPAGLQETVQPLSDANIDSLSELACITSLADFVSRQMMGIHVSDMDLQRKFRLAERVKAGSKLDKYNEGQLTLIKDHPFYKQVVGGGE